MDKQPKNHGEGDADAAARLNEAEQSFVKSDRGKKKLRKGARVHPDEEWSLKDAERLGHERAKGGPESSADLETMPDG